MSEGPAPTASLLLAGASGFAYDGWTPSFYPPGLPAADRLRYYAAHLPAVELNNTFYARPTESRIRGWTESVPAGFRFVIKAQRGAAMRSMLGAASESVPWLTERLGTFGPALGAVLFAVPGNIHRRADGSSDAALHALLAAWPPTVSLVMEFADPSWHVDETFAALAAHGAILCATEGPDDPEPPTVRVTGPALYLRLRRHAYSDDELARWAQRIEPFLNAGTPVFAFFRHDEAGLAPAMASRLLELAGQAPGPIAPA